MATTFPSDAEVRSLDAHIRTVMRSAGVASNADAAQNVVAHVDINALSATAQDANLRRRVYIVTKKPTDTMLPDSKIGDIAICYAVEKTAGLTDASVYIKSAIGWSSALVSTSASQVIAGVHTTTAATKNTILVTGAEVGDTAVVAVSKTGATPRTITSYNIATVNAITVTMSDDPSTDHELSYIVMRANL